jgi:hypothetical protein
MSENDEYLTELYNKTGKTNLGDYFVKYLQSKQEKER